MADRRRSILARLLLRLRIRMAQGLVALVPVLVTFLVLRFIFNLTSGILLPVVDPALDHWPWLARALLSLTILLAGLYLLGEIISRVVGRRLLDLGEAVVLKLPLVRVVYRAAKQVMAAFQGPGARAFKSVVFIEFPRPGMRAVAFVTGSFQEGEQVWVTVFVPTTPNPTTGFLQVVKEEELVHTDFSVEDGVKMVMSLGALVPEAAAPDV